VLRTEGISSAVKKGKVPLLERLARQVAASSNPSAEAAMTSGSVDRRRQAIAEQIRALIKPAADRLPVNDAEPIAELLALRLRPDDQEPNRQERRENAVAKTDHKPSYFLKVERELLKKLARLMYVHYQTYASESATPEPSEPVQPEVPHEKAPLHNDSSTEAEAETSIAHEQPAKTESACTPDTEAPVEPEHEETLQASKPAVRGPSRRVRYLATLIAAIVVAAVTFVLATDRGGIITAGSCGATTAQLFSPGSSVTTPSAIYIYAPHQEGAQHGWANAFAGLLSEPRQKEVFRAGAVRLLALSYHNQSASTTEKNLIARVGLPQGARLQPNSTCLYHANNYASGDRYSGTPLLGSTGLSVGNVAPNEYVYVTFEAQLPRHAELTTNIYGGIDDQAELGGGDWTQKVSHIQLELTG
jgi:hypothetical protein